MKLVIDNIKRIRKEKGISQKDLSEKTGIPLATYKRIELSDGDVGLTNLNKIASALQIDIDTLMKKPSTVITVANTKGGVGKSTFIAHFAKYLNQATDKTICILDSDVQQSIANIHNENSVVDVRSFMKGKSSNEIIDYQDEINALKEEYDIILIDTIGSSEDLSFIQTAINLSDILITPFHITRMAIMEMGVMAHLIEYANKKKEKRNQEPIKAFAIASHVVKNSIESKNLKTLDFGDGITVLKNMIHHSLDYQRADDLEVILTVPRDGHEFDILMQELNKSINLF